MMRNHTPKIKKSVIPEQHIQYFSSRATGSAEKNFTELLAARDKHILRRRFAAETLGGLLEPVVDTKDRVRLAIKYYGFLKLRRYSMRQYSWDESVEICRAFVVGDAYLSKDEIAAAEAVLDEKRASIKKRFAAANSASTSWPVTVVENTRANKNKPLAESNIPVTIAAPKTPPASTLPPKAPKSGSKKSGGDEIDPTFKALIEKARANKNKPLAESNIPVTIAAPTYNPLLILEERAAAKSRGFFAKIRHSPAKVLSKAHSEKVLINKVIDFSAKANEELQNAEMDRYVAAFEKLANIKPEDMASTYSSPRAIMSGERKMPPASTLPPKAPKPGSKKSGGNEIDPVLTALIEKARARGKRTSSFLSPEEIPYLIKDSQVHKTVLFLSTSYMFYHYPNTIYYTAYIIFAYFVYLCVSRYNKYVVWMSKDFEYAKFLSWTSEAYQRDLHRRMQARYPHKVKKSAPDSKK